MALFFDSGSGKQPVGKIRALPDNDIKYGMDFSFYQGVPPGVYDVYDRGVTWRLVGPGYGAWDDYGNGAIYITQSMYPTWPVPGLEIVAGDEEDATDPPRPSWPMPEIAEPEKAIAVRLVFDDWQRDGASIYSSPEGVELSAGDFHSGTTFRATIEMGLDAAEELLQALRDGFTPTFYAILPKEDSTT